MEISSISVMEIGSIWGVVTNSIQDVLIISI
jgi:hypothetical protein